ncbi:hypothetical protein Celaphus_00000200, partial [Cervus elaphus hippelaphus]
MLPQTRVSRGRSFHHQSRVCDEVGKGHLPGAEQKLHAVPFSLMLAQDFPVLGTRTHLARGPSGPPIGSPDSKVLSGSVASPPTWGNTVLSLTS